MTTQVKICGLKTEAALAAALDSGADYVGLVFCAASPRNIDADTARAARRRGARPRQDRRPARRPRRPRARRGDRRRPTPTYIQLHGAETPERVADIAQRFRRPVMKAVQVASRADAEAALCLSRTAPTSSCSTPRPPADRAGALPGGNGVAFDWQALESVRGKLDSCWRAGSRRTTSARPSASPAPPRSTSPRASRAAPARRIPS